MSYNNEKRMSEKNVIIVFPSIYSLNKIKTLITSIAQTLRIKNQPVNTIRQDESVIVVDASDPVLASSAISMLFGIERVAISREVDSNFDSALASIVNIGLSLLLRGETFHIKVEGKTKNFLVKDLEIAATASLIDKSVALQVKPASEEDHDKLIYTFLTDSHAYVCIFIDKGLGGLPYGSQGKKILCCIYDELSAISCLQTIKMGFDVKFLICYRNESDLLRLSKMIVKIIPRVNQETIFLNVCRLTGNSSLLTMINTITHIMISLALKEKINRIALATSPMIFPASFVESNSYLVFKNKLFPWFPLSGIDNGILENAREIGLEKYISNLKELCKKRLDEKKVSISEASKNAKDSLKTLKSISITLGPNNLHDIIDSLKSQH